MPIDRDPQMHTVRNRFTDREIIVWTILVLGEVKASWMIL